jgi:hypothetical protein
MGVKDLRGHLPGQPPPPCLGQSALGFWALHRSVLRPHVLALPVQLPERKPRAFARRVKCLPTWLRVDRGSVLSAPIPCRVNPGASS